MLSIEDALSLVLAECKPLPPKKISLSDALGCCLAQEVISDIDSPPHDKSLMDGYAVRSEDLRAGVTEFEVIEEVLAGQVPTKSVEKNQATGIMTGAPLPAGADCVVMVEHSAIFDKSQPNRVRIQTSSPGPGQHIMPRATSMRKGQRVLPAGHVLRPLEIGLLAEVGRTSVSVFSKPRLKMLPTGDELVNPGEIPGPGQIRNSNGPLVAAAAERAGAQITLLEVARDRKEHLKPLVEQGLDSEVLVLSGGVSAGNRDLVPAILADLGVEQVFHKINLKPGRPMWFGKRTSEDKQTLVFGLPGNPVSSLVCFELFVVPSIKKLSGYQNPEPAYFKARLKEPHQLRGPRPTFHPAWVELGSDGYEVASVKWEGSPDLCSLAQANCLVYFPVGDTEYPAGDSMNCLWL